jgi:uncharacterized OsmC-like protein
LRAGRAAVLSVRRQALPERPRLSVAIATLAPRLPAPTIKTIQAQETGMPNQTIAAALHRLASLLERRPEAGLHDDAPATARWEGGTKVLTRHADGTQFRTDLPGELGGTETAVTPGWYLRGALAACSTTCIVMAAARAGIELGGLEIHAGSQSDARGLLGVADDGQSIPAGPLGVELLVRISAPRVPPEQLQALVEAALARSPVGSAMRAVPLRLRVDVWTS